MASKAGIRTYLRQEFPEKVWTDAQLNDKGSIP